MCPPHQSPPEVSAVSSFPVSLVVEAFPDGSAGLCDAAAHDLVLAG